MRSVKYFGLLLLIFQIILPAAGKTEEERYVFPVENDVPVFTGRIHGGQEVPEFRVGMQDRLTVTAESRGRYKIRTGKGASGWVDKKKVTVQQASKRFVFSNADVHGYLDDPSPVYIIDTDDPDDVSMMLDHSFKDALKENVDKYTSERNAEHESGKLNF